MNKFRQDERENVRTFRLDPALERQQVERLQALRASRDNGAVSLALKTLEETARGTGNLMPPILDCCTAYATVGEISDRLRAVFGEYQER